MHQLIRRATVAAAVAVAALLAACAGPGASYRDTSRQLYSIGVFDPSRFVGAWHEVAGFAAPGATCALGVTGAAVGPGGLSLELSGCAGPKGRVAAPQIAPARFAPQLTGPLDAPWWVLWVDQDYRTVVIGTPSGRFGAVLNRTATIPADRLEAARRILDFNGYDVSRMGRWR